MIGGDLKFSLPHESCGEVPTTSSQLFLKVSCNNGEASQKYSLGAKCRRQVLGCIYTKRRRFLEPELGRKGYTTPILVTIVKQSFKIFSY